MSYTLKTHAEEGLAMLEKLAAEEKPNRKAIHGAVNYYLPEIKRELAALKENARTLNTSLSANIREFERMEAELAAVRVNPHHQCEHNQIVHRIWEQLGNPSYEELKGRSIYDLIAALKADAERYRWLRSWECINHQYSPWCVRWDSPDSHDLGQTHPIEGIELDAAIDLAMQPTPEEK